MSYMGNTYMPTVDAIAIEAARSYVKHFGEHHTHEFPCVRELVASDEQAFRYLVNVIDEAREEFADGGGDMSYDGGYAGKVFEALAFGFATLMEGDWSPYDCSDWKVSLHGQG